MNDKNESPDVSSDAAPQAQPGEASTVIPDELNLETMDPRSLALLVLSEYAQVAAHLAQLTELASRVKTLENWQAAMDAELMKYFEVHRQFMANWNRSVKIAMTAKAEGPAN